MAYVILGVAGFVLLLFAYMLSLFAVVDQDSFYFNLLNFFGAIMLAYYVNESGNLTITLLPTIWAFVALCYMVSHAYKKVKKPDSRTMNKRIEKRIK